MSARGSNLLSAPTTDKRAHLADCGFARSNSFLDDALGMLWSGLGSTRSCLPSPDAPMKCIHPQSIHMILPCGHLCKGFCGKKVQYAPWHSSAPATQEPSLFRSCSNSSSCVVQARRRTWEGALANWVNRVKALLKAAAFTQQHQTACRCSLCMHSCSSWMPAGHALYRAG